MEEQHRIAEFLTLFDKRIEKQKELIDGLVSVFQTGVGN